MTPTPQPVGALVATASPTPPSAEALGHAHDAHAPASGRAGGHGLAHAALGRGTGPRP